MITNAIIILLMVQIILGAVSAWISLAQSGFDPSASPSGPNQEKADIYLSLYGSVFNILGILILHFYVEGRSLTSLGLKQKSDNQTLLKESLTLPIVITLLLVALQLTKQISISVNPNFQIGSFIALLIGFLLQAVSQEIIFRGYIMNALCVDGKILQGIWVNSVMIALFYALNSNISLVGTVNLLLFSAILSYLFYFYSDLRLSMLTNSLFQVLLGPLFGTHFMGQSYTDSLLITRLHDQHDVFSFDQSILFTIVLILYLSRLHFKIIKLETDQEEQHVTKKHRQP